MDASQFPRTRPWHRASAAMILAVVAVLTTSGCGVLPRMCSAVGWSNMLVVEAPDSVEGTDVANACVNGSCSSPDAASTVTAADNLNTVTRSSSGEWIYTLLDMSAPALVTVELLGGDGGLLAEEQLPADWLRIGGSEECGGPHEARVEIRP